ncbi:MAG: hypothetical protein JNK84_02535 [Phreatobacter sp.]|uniref:hypothetical protein n=1 Tax=Phreatobacter sp. TaxID=1966341 RepID=UPI001A58CBBB|nr:hypothetical protein [Phreatobacter sp.]MBL8567939.1 hypothetical protein [Phreatobacter sp.]
MTTESGKRPTHILWQVIGEGDNARWTRIGASWENADRRGYSLKYDAIPLTGRTVLRAYDPDDSAAARS